MHSRRMDVSVTVSTLAAVISALTFLFPAEIHSRVVLPQEQVTLPPVQYQSPKNKPQYDSGDKSASCHIPIVKRFGVVVLRPSSASSPGPSIVYPEQGENTIEIGPTTEIQLFCPGKDNGVATGSTAIRSSHVPVSCAGDELIVVGNDTYNALDIRCNKPSRSVAKFSGETCGGPDVPEIVIGFPVGRDGFVTTIKTCFHDDWKAALFSKYTIQASIHSSAKGVRRPYFDAGDFYRGIDVNELYKQKNQMKTLRKILNSTELAEKYKFFNRGHLAAKADFIYAAEQKATFYYVNVAPQWGSFNRGNWNSLEDNIRNMVAKLGRSVEVYVGTYGITTLPDINNEEQELYLYYDDNGNKAVPVPKLFWKMVYDPESRKGVVVLGVNNPHLNPIPEDYILCESVCSQIRWIRFNVKNEKLGYTYCCTVSDFRNAVANFVPDIQVDSLLT